MRHNSNSRMRAGSPNSDALAAALGFPSPPAEVQLREEEMPFWDMVVRARLPQQWVDFDLIHAANLARCLCDIEIQRGILAGEGDMVENARGDAVVNPRHKLIEQLSKRSLSLTRVLQLHAVATTGQSEGQGMAKASASAIHAAMAGVANQNDDLLARPSH